MRLSCKVAFVALSLLAVISCRKDERATVKYSAQTQSKKIENTLCKAIDLANVQYADETLSAIKDLSSQIENAADASAFGTWADELSKEFTTEETREGAEGTDVYKKFVLELSRCTGSFTVKDGVWKRVDDKNLDITWKDPDGMTCVLAVKVVDGRTEILVKDETTDISAEGKTAYEHTRQYVTLPSFLSASLVRGGRKIASAVVMTSSSVRDSDIWWKDSRISFVADVKADDLEYVVSRARLRSNGITLNFELYNGKEMIVGAEAAVDGLEWGDEGIFPVEGASDLELDVDVLGELQLVGSADLKAVSEADEIVEANPNDRTKVESAVSMMNRAVRFTLFFDGYTRNPQGHIAFALDGDETSGFRTRTYYCLHDGSEFTGEIISERVQRHLKLWLEDLSDALSSEDADED